MNAGQIDSDSFDGIQNAVYYLGRIKKNLKMQQINNSSWLGKIESLEQHLQDLNNQLIGENTQQLNIYHVNQSLNKCQEIFFLPLIKLTENFIDDQYTIEHNQIGYFINQLGFVIYNKQLIQQILEYIPVMLIQSLDCIFLKPQNDECWTLINKNLQIIQVDTDENLHHSFKTLQKFVHIGMSYMILAEQLKQKNIFSIFINQNYGMAKCLLNSEKATSNTLMMFTNPNLQFSIKLARQTEQFFIKQSIKAVLPQIKYHQVLYIPRLFEPLTFQEIQKEINQPFNKTSSPKLIMEDIPLNIIKFNSDSIQVRLLSTQKNIMRTTIDKNLLSSVVQGVQQDKPIKTLQTDTTIKKIVYHIHGGGWISTSSFFHQNYTRKWANFLGDDTLIISIDYRLSPEYTYPYALDDCWQVYLWIVNFASVYLKTNVEQIVITGDSAGGNMALGVTYRAIKQNVRKPDGLSLIYPAMNLGMERYAPSNFNGILDTLFPFSMVILAIKSYLNVTGIQSSLDPYISPVVACDEYMQELPNIIITCGSLDGQKDECIKFMYRLLTLKSQGKTSAQVKMKIYNGFPHGYLSFDFPGNPFHQVRTLANDSAKILQELFQTI